MKTNVRYWRSVLQEAERELEAATGNITLKAAAKRYMRAKAEVKRLEQTRVHDCPSARAAACGGPL